MNQVTRLVGGVLSGLVALWAWWGFLRLLRSGVSGRTAVGELAVGTLIALPSGLLVGFLLATSWSILALWSIAASCASTLVYLGCLLYFRKQCECVELHLQLGRLEVAATASHDLLLVSAEKAKRTDERLTTMQRLFIDRVKQCAKIGITSATGQELAVLKELMTSDSSHRIDAATELLRLGVKSGQDYLIRIFLDEPRHGPGKLAGRILSEVAGAEVFPRLLKGAEAGLEGELVREVLLAILNRDAPRASVSDLRALADLRPIHSKGEVGHEATGQSVVYAPERTTDSSELRIAATQELERRR